MQLKWHQALPAGDREGRHRHKIAVELTAVISGRVRMAGRYLMPARSFESSLAKLLTSKHWKIVSQ